MDTNKVSRQKLTTEEVYAGQGVKPPQPLPTGRTYAMQEAAAAMMRSPGYYLDNGLQETVSRIYRELNPPKPTKRTAPRSGGKAVVGGTVIISGSAW